MNSLKAADRYTLLKQEQDRIAAEIEKVRTELLATGREEIVGDFCIIRVRLSDRKTVDWKAAAAAHLDETTRKACEAEYAKVTRNIATLEIKPKMGE